MKGTHQSSKSSNPTVTPQRRRLDLGQPGGRGQLDQLALVGPGAVRLVRRVRIEVADRPPEEGQRTVTAAVVPDAGSDRAARPRHPAHLAQPLDGVGHEVHDQLGQGGVEAVVGEGQLLGGAGAHVDLREACGGGRDERWRRVDRGHRVRAEPADQLGGQRARPAADVQHPLSGVHAAHASANSAASGSENRPMKRP